MAYRHLYTTEQQAHRIMTRKSSTSPYQNAKLIVALGITCSEDRLRRDFFGKNNRDAPTSWHTSTLVAGLPDRALSFTLSDDNSYLSNLIIDSFVKGSLLNLCWKSAWSSRMGSLMTPVLWKKMLMTIHWSVVYSDVSALFDNL
jgi:hypothetical protein